jgi:hypothetical protein
MKVLVATGQTQGRRASDFNYAREGEIVGMDDEHTPDEEKPDGGCGCQRSLVGVESGKSTTTFRVIDAGYTREEYADLIRDARADYAELGIGDDNFRAEADLLLEIAARFDVGAVVERRGGDNYREREH